MNISRRTKSSRALRRCIDNVLDAREAEIIRLRYAIGGGEAMTQRETAQRCGISRRMFHASRKGH